jgi:hypothetical protein
MLFFAKNRNKMLNILLFCFYFENEFLLFQKSHYFLIFLQFKKFIELTSNFMTVIMKWMKQVVD